MAGGQTVVVSGSGFTNMTLDVAATEVSICGVPCLIESVDSATSLICITGEYAALDTPIEDHLVLPVRSGQATGSGSSHEQVHYKVDNLFDEDVSTTWRSALVAFNCVFPV